MPEPEFDPFYERWATCLKMGPLGKVLLAAFPGMLFFLPYFVVTEGSALADWSWLLAALISVAVLFLYYATATLRGLMLFMAKCEPAGYLRNFNAPLAKTLRDRNFMVAGVLFGTANMVMAWAFGVDCTSPLERGILFGGFFLAGFTCGMPAFGIYGVIAAFRRLTSATRVELDYTSPDRCGGMSTVGNALVKFSVVTMLQGVLIASYVLLYDWAHSADIRVELLMWAWIFVPFLLSALVLLIPSLDINLMLAEYRHDLEQQIKIRLIGLRKRIENTETDAGREGLCGEYDFLRQRREEVHNMHTWPFSVGATASFAGALIPNILVAVELARSLL